MIIVVLFISLYNMNSIMDAYIQNNIII